MNRFILPILLFLLTFNLYAEDKYQIGILNPSSGKFQDYGANCLKGYQEAMTQLNPATKEKLQFIFEDDQSTVQGGLNAFHKILREKNLIASFLLGSHIGVAINPLSNKNKLPVFGLSGHPDFLTNNEYSFGFWFDSKSEAQLISKYILDKKFQKIAIFTLESDFSIYNRKFLKSFIEGKDVEIVFDEIVYNETDYRTLITKLKSKKPDIIFLNVAAENFYLIAKQLYEQSITTQKITVTASATEKYFRLAGDSKATDNTIVYVIDYAQKYILKKPIIKDSPLPAYVYGCYMGMKFLLTEVEKLLAHNNLSKETLYWNLLDTKELVIDGIKTPIKDRRIEHQLKPFTVKDYKLVPVDRF